MKWVFYVVVFVYIFYRAVSLAQEEGGEPILKVKTIANTYNVGDRKGIYCEVNFLKGDLEWYNPTGEKIPKRSTDFKRVYVELRPVPSTGGFFLELRINPMELEDTGSYTCKSGDLSDTIEIFVGEKVVMNDAEEDYINEEGNHTTMSCQARGTPQPEIQWYKDNKTIVSSDKYKIWNKPKISTGYLRINYLNRLDSGTYICKATQEKISHFAEKACHLSVQHKPVIMNEYSEREVYAILDEWKPITCKAIANPPPNFTWSKHSGSFNEEMKGETDDFKGRSQNIHTCPQVTSDATSSVLALHITNETLGEQYKCTVENSMGRQNFIFHVSLGNKPEPPTAVTVVAATTNNITFNVSCKSCIFDEDNGLAPKPENLTVLGYVFELVEYKDGFEEPFWLNATRHQFDIAENNGTTTFTIEGLQKGTKYYVRVATRNLAGESEWFTLPTNPETSYAATALAKSIELLILAFIVSFCY